MLHKSLTQREQSMNHREHFLFANGVITHFVIWRPIFITHLNGVIDQINVSPDQIKTH